MDIFFLFFFGKIRALLFKTDLSTVLRKNLCAVSSSILMESMLIILKSSMLVFKKHMISLFYFFLSAPINVRPVQPAKLKGELLTYYIVLETRSLATKGLASCSQVLKQ